MYPNKVYEDIIKSHLKEQKPGYLDTFDAAKPRGERAYIDPSAPMLSEAQRLAVLGGDTSLSALAKGILEGKYKNIIVLTGAGISTNSGIPGMHTSTSVNRQPLLTFVPDFRSKDKGLYSNPDLKDKLNIPSTTAAFGLGDFMENPATFYRIVQEVFLPVVRGRYKYVKT